MYWLQFMINHKAERKPKEDNLFEDFDLHIQPRLNPTFFEYPFSHPQPEPSFLSSIARKLYIDGLILQTSIHTIEMENVYLEGVKQRVESASVINRLVGETLEQRKRRNRRNAD